MVKKINKNDLESLNLNFSWQWYVWYGFFKPIRNQHKYWKYISKNLTNVWVVEYFSFCISWTFLFVIWSRNSWTLFDLKHFPCVLEDRRLYPFQTCAAPHFCWSWGHYQFWNPVHIFCHDKEAVLSELVLCMP